MPVELGGNPLRLHCMPAWSNLNDFHPNRPPNSTDLTGQAYNVISMIYTQFDHQFDQVGIQCNLNDLHPIRLGRHTM